MFSLAFDADGVVERLQTTALLAEDLEPALRKFGGYLVKKAKARYEAQSFAPLAGSTMKHRAQAGLKAMEKKLAKDVSKAIGRAKIAAAPKGLVARTMASLGLATQIAAMPTKGVTNRAAVLAEFRRQHGKGESGLMRLAGGKKLTLKQVASLGARTSRAVEKAMSRPILGKLSKSPMYTVGNGEVTLTSRTKEHWSDVHNAGGTAGHGANIPERKTIMVDAEDIEVLRRILEEHCLLAFEE